MKKKRGKVAPTPVAVRLVTRPVTIISSRRRRGGREARASGTAADGTGAERGGVARGPRDPAGRRGASRLRPSSSDSRVSSRSPVPVRSPPAVLGVACAVGVGPISSRLRHTTSHVVTPGGDSTAYVLPGRGGRDSLCWGFSDADLSYAHVTGSRRPRCAT
jgi:hypothetical protein